MRYLAASQNGVAPVRAGSKFRSREARREGVHVVSRVFGSAPLARSSAAIFASRRMIATWSAEKPALAAVGLALLARRKLTISPKPEWAASVVALIPQASSSFGFAPAASRSFVDSRSPTRAARRRDVSFPWGMARL